MDVSTLRISDVSHALQAIQAGRYSDVDLTVGELTALTELIAPVVVTDVDGNDALPLLMAFAPLVQIGEAVACELQRLDAAA